MNDRDLRRNASGYSDPTAYEVMKNESKEEVRVRRLLRIILEICAIAGFKVDSRIVLIDKVNGRVWR